MESRTRPAPTLNSRPALPCGASACAKIILCGEHAVVYGQPAIALPLPQLRTHVRITPSDGPPRVAARNLKADFPLFQPDPAGELWPLREAVRLGWEAVKGTSDVGRRTSDERASSSDVRSSDLPTISSWEGFPLVHIDISSDIPMAAGMGSGAAASVALVRGIAALSGREWAPEEHSRLAFEVEKLHHGTPSGVDNTVIAFEQPVFFTRAGGPQPLRISRALHLLIADSGQRSSTREMVAGVRRCRDRMSERFSELFESVGRLVNQVRDLLARGRTRAIGPLLDQNHQYLQLMGVSTPRLDWLVEVARGAGALGAKLSGAGGGGVVLALVEKKRIRAVRRAWEEHAGVEWIHQAEIPAYRP